MATVKIGTKPVGSTVKIKVNGTLRDFTIRHQGRPSTLYDTSCDGTWVLMEDIYLTRAWHGSNVNDYANSDVHKYLNNDFLNLIDANIRNQIKQVKIPYRPGSGTSTTVSSGANGLSCKIFLLSGYEVGFTQANTNQYMPIDGAKLADFLEGNDSGSEARNKRIAKYNGTATSWWLRSPSTNYSTSAWNCNSNGSDSSNDCTNTYGVRPAFILPSDLSVNDDGTVTVNTAPTTPASITVPSTINGGESVAISWSASTDAEGNLEGYELERSTDSGSSWQNVYKGSATNTTNTVPFGTESVMYRVRAYDSQGLYSSYKSSSQVPVINNNPPTVPASITVPNEVTGGGKLTITWGASTDSDGNLSGYALERQFDSGDWSEIFRGNSLNFTDTITKGWASVAYRVRAYDDRNAYSGYITSETRTVNNNTPPAITCTYPSGSDLGEKSDGFSVEYSVRDDDGDAVTVKENVDGTQKRSFPAVQDQQNTFSVDGEDFMKLLNGKHTLAINATDGKATTTHTLTFTKSVTSAFITLQEPMEADAPISICVLSVIGDVPADADFTVEVTNNALDDEPTWEDCTTAVKAGANYIFENQEAPSNTPAFNFRINVSRGESGKGGHISSIQGGFQ